MSFHSRCQAWAGSEVCLPQVTATLTSSARVPRARASSIHLLLPQEEQLVLVRGQEAGRPLGSGRQFLGPLWRREKQDPFRDSFVSAHLPDGDAVGLGGWSLDRVAQCPLVQHLKPVPSASKVSITSLPHAHVCYSPGHQCLHACLPPFSWTLCLLPFKKIKISPQQLEGALKHFNQIDSSPNPPLVKPIPASGPSHLLCPPWRLPFLHWLLSSSSGLYPCPLFRRPPHHSSPFCCLPNTHLLPKTLLFSQCSVFLLLLDSGRGTGCAQ